MFSVSFSYKKFLWCAIFSTFGLLKVFWTTFPYKNKKKKNSFREVLLCTFCTSIPFFCDLPSKWVSSPNNISKLTSNKRSNTLKGFTVPKRSIKTPDLTEKWKILWSMLIIWPKWNVLSCSCLLSSSIDSCLLSDIIWNIKRCGWRWKVLIQLIRNRFKDFKLLSVNFFWIIVWWFCNRLKLNLTRNMYHTREWMNVECCGSLAFS